MISDKIKETIFRTHSKSFDLGTIPQSIVREDNEACLKFATMPNMSLRIKHIGLPDHFFWTKVEELDIAVIRVSNHDQLADQFNKGMTVELFVKARKGLLGW